MNNLSKFLQAQRILAIATANSSDIWIANVYIGTDENNVIYFISPEDARHSQMILKNPKVAFSAAWFDPKNHGNRKGVQGNGLCRVAENDSEIAEGVRLHNLNFPEFKQRITVDWVKNNEWKSKVWVLKPSFIKYWDDEAYGENESEDFHFN